MKVLFNCHTPFSLAHGGMQVQIEQSKKALEQIGVEVEFLRWWDERQTGNILHHFGPMPGKLAQFARAKGYQVIVTILLTQECNRSSRQVLIRQLGIGALLSLPLPPRIKEKFPWQAARNFDHLTVGLEAERNVLKRVYGVAHQNISIVPLGLTDAFLKAGPPLRNENHLICTGTIIQSKNSLELARLAIQAKAPILFVGKPYDFESEYWKEFQRLVDGKFVKHHSHVKDEAEIVQLLRRARGYVLMSRYENWCLAAHEAAGCGLPVLLPDQNWSRERFGDQAHFFPKKGSAVVALKEFYDKSPALPSPHAHLPTWTEAAEKLRAVYISVLKCSSAE